MPSRTARNISAIRILSKPRFQPRCPRNMPLGFRGRISPVKTQPARYYGMGNLKAEQGGTTHFSVLDRFGNAVACTLSVNTRFGSKILVPKTGIVLNNEMDDFAIYPSGNVYGLVGNEANSLQPKKRPLSSMTPTIILQGDRPELIVGGAVDRGLSARPYKRFLTFWISRCRSRRPSKPRVFTINGCPMNSTSRTSCRQRPRRPSSEGGTR